MSLYDQLSGGVNNFASTGNPSIGGAGMGLTPQQGNPVFQSQIDLSVETIVSKVIIVKPPVLFAASESGGVTNDMFGPANKVIQEYNPNTQGELLSSFGDSLPVVLFGNSDFSAGFARAISLNQPTLGKYVGGFIIDQNGLAISLDAAAVNATASNTPTVEFHSEAVKQGKAKLGDMILVYATESDNSVEADLTLVSSFQVAEVVVSCPQVAYATLLDSISSDTFVIDGIRYTIPDVTKIDQFTNAIHTVRQSLFGKLQSDSMNPNSMNMPFNNQTNIIDVPLQLGVDKNLIVNTRINTSCRKFIWSLFIKTTQKIKA